MLMSDREYDAVLVDFSWLLKRSFHAFQQQNPTVLGERPGETIYTGDVYGVLDTLTRIRKLSPDAVIVLCVDMKNPDGSYTNKVATEGYKAGRTQDEAFAKYEEAVALGCMLNQVFRAGIPGAEADEIIVTLAGHLSSKGKEVLIYSRDKDMRQAIGERVRQVHSIKHGRYHEVLDTDAVKEIYGCPPGAVRMWQAIRGDGIDGIKGYPRFQGRFAGLIAENFPTPDLLFNRDKNLLPLNVEKQAKKLDAWEENLRKNYLMVRMDLVDIKDINFTIPAKRPDLIQKYELLKFKLTLEAEDSGAFETRDM